MKKKIFGGIAFAAVALAMVFNLSVKQDSNKLSALAMENVEALAQETGGPVQTPCPTTGSECVFKCIVGGVEKECTIKGYRSM